MIGGIVGAIVPGIPGPPLSYAGLILAHVSQTAVGKAGLYKPSGLLIFGIIAVVAFAGDYVIPLMTGKKYGISKQGTWGSVIGMIVGMIATPVLGPFGIIIGILGGAFIGEMIAGKEKSEALRAGWGSFIGTMFAIVLKLSFAAIVAALTAIKLIKLINI